MFLTDIIAEFYSANSEDVESMSEVLYATTPIDSNADIIQAMVVGVEDSILSQEFTKHDIKRAYADLDKILSDMCSKIGDHCLMICDKDDLPLPGHFICEVKQVRENTAVVTIGVIEEVRQYER